MHLYKQSVITLLGINCLCFGEIAKKCPNSGVAFPDKVKIDQPIEQLEELLEELDPQQFRNYTVSNIAFLYEIKVFLLFSEYLSTLPENDKPAAIAEQNRWKAEHTRKVEEGYNEYISGTLASYSAGLAGIESCKARIAILERQMQARCF